MMKKLVFWLFIGLIGGSALMASSEKPKVKNVEQEVEQSKEYQEKSKAYLKALGEVTRRQQMFELMRQFDLYKESLVKAKLAEKEDKEEKKESKEEKTEEKTIEDYATLAKKMDALPLSMENIEERTKQAEEIVKEESHKKVKQIVEAIPDGHFKFLLRKAYYQNYKNPLDAFPIKFIAVQLNEAKNINFRGLSKVTDISWLPSELYRLNQEKKIVQNITFYINPLPQLLEHLLDYCPQLKVFRVYHCNLSQIPEHLFDNCGQLEELNLGGNNLSALPDHLVNVLINNCPKLTRVELSANPWNTKFPEDLVKALSERGVTVVN